MATLRAHGPVTVKATRFSLPTPEERECGVLGWITTWTWHWEPKKTTANNFCSLEKREGVWRMPETGKRPTAKMFRKSTRGWRVRKAAVRLPVHPREFAETLQRGGWIVDTLDVPGHMAVQLLIG